jgi:hypothetical protein
VCVAEVLMSWKAFHARLCQPIVVLNLFWVCVSDYCEFDAYEIKIFYPSLRLVLVQNRYVV